MKPWFLHKVQCRHQKRHIVLGLALVHPRTGRVRQKPVGYDRVSLTYNAQSGDFFVDREYRRALDLDVDITHFRMLAVDIDEADIYHTFERPPPRG